MIAAAQAGDRAAIVGASFIALEAAASLIGRKLQVNLIASEEIPLASKMGEEVGRFVQQLHAEKDEQFYLGRTVRNYDGERLTLDDGGVVEVDFIVVGTVVDPRIDLAESAGLRIAPKDEGGGVEVDGQLRTSAANVYAIGDISNYPDDRLGQRIRVEHWVHAQRQGQFIARLLIGEATRFGDTPFFLERALRQKPALYRPWQPG